MSGLDYTIISANYELLLKGLGLSVLLTLLAILGGLAFGTLLAVARVFGGAALSALARIYVDLIRGVPLILVIFWFFFLTPLVLGRPVGPFVSALIAFVMFEAAYYSEIIRSGIGAVRMGQWHAALASGMSRTQAFRLVILPQAIRAALPILITQSIILFQDTSLVYVVTLRDFVTSASLVANREFRLVEVYTFVAAVFLIICVPASLFVQHLKRQAAIR